MYNERSFPDFREIHEEIKDAGRNWESDDDLSVAMDFIAENFSDAHLNIDINNLTDEDFKLARKFQEGTLGENEIAEEIDRLPDGNDRSNFLAALRNKLVARNGWKKREEKKLRESRQDGTA